MLAVLLSVSRCTIGNILAIYREGRSLEPFMRAFAIVFLLLTLVSGSLADEADDAKWTTLYNNEKAGVRYYKKGSYKKAYEKLLYPAQLGLKDAQRQFKN